jgi:hypothetical protein
MLFSQSKILGTVRILCEWIAKMIDANIYQLFAGSRKTLPTEDGLLWECFGLGLGYSNE